MIRTSEKSTSGRRKWRPRNTNSADARRFFKRCLSVCVLLVPCLGDTYRYSTEGIPPPFPPPPPTFWYVAYAISIDLSVCLSVYQKSSSSLFLALPLSWSLSRSSPSFTTSLPRPATSIWTVAKTRNPNTSSSSATNRRESYKHSLHPLTPLLDPQQEI